MSESGSQSHPDDAMVDLLVKQVTEGLSPVEQRALDAMDEALVAGQRRGFERAAAAVTLAGIAPVELPPALQALLQQQGERHLAARRVVEFKASPAAAAAPDSRRPASRGGGLGWFAAAACLVLAVVGWMRSPQLTVPPVADVHLGLPPVVVTPPPVPPTAAEERAALLARSDSIKVTLAATKDPAAAGVTGDAVWDPVSQRGFVHFAGLASNDPSVRQYQIWIFDGGRDKRYPVDAGVFDVPANAAEVVIPIHAVLPIGLAKAFAVTVEKSGGVVVSGLAHVVALGAASS